MNTIDSNHTKIVVSSLAALLGALSCTNSESCQIVYVPILRNKGAASKFRNLEMQEKILVDIGKMFGFETCYVEDPVRAREIISCDSIKIIDVNSLGYLNCHARNLTNVSHFIGAGSEHLSAFIPRIPTLNLKDFRLRITILNNYFLKFGIREVHCFVDKNSHSFLFWKAIPINRNNYRDICQLIFEKLQKEVGYEFLEDLSVEMVQSLSKKLLVFLPVAAHYGGSENDYTKNLEYIFKLFPREDFYILIKSHPSDGKIKKIEANDFKTACWDSDLSRTFPIEIILNAFQDRLVLLSAGSSAMFAVENGSKFMFYPNTNLGEKLAKRNSNHLLKSYSVIQIPD